jgi:hypothetical protein
MESLISKQFWEVRFKNIAGNMKTIKFLIFEFTSKIRKGND